MNDEHCSQCNATKPTAEPSLLEAQCYLGLQENFQQNDELQDDDCRLMRSGSIQEC